MVYVESLLKVAIIEPMMVCSVVLLSWSITLHMKKIAKTFFLVCHTDLFIILDRVQGRNQEQNFGTQAHINSFLNLSKTL